MLKKVGFAIVSKVGGVSGPIWGTAFLRAGAEAGDRTELTPEELIAMLRAAIEGIMPRGEASLGDKTLLDALVPAIDSLEASFADPATADDHGVAALQNAADVAVQAAEDTERMLAIRGRAAYTGERSRGSVDAGATAIGVIFQDISAAWREKYTNHRRPRHEEVRQRPKQFVPEILEGIQLASGGASSTSRSTT